MFFEKRFVRRLDYNLVRARLQIYFGYWPRVCVRSLFLLDWANQNSLLSRHRTSVNGWQTSKTHKELSPPQRHVANNQRKTARMPQDIGDQPSRKSFREKQSCILETRMFVHWLLPHGVDSVTPHLAVYHSLLVFLQVCYWLRAVQGVSNKLRSNRKHNFSVHVFDIYLCWGTECRMITLRHSPCTLPRWSRVEATTPERRKIRRAWCNGVSAEATRVGHAQRLPHHVQWRIICGCGARHHVTLPRRRRRHRRPTDRPRRVASRRVASPHRPRGPALSTVSRNLSRKVLQHKGRGKREIPEKTRRPTTSSFTIPTCENPVTRPGIELVSPWWEASVLMAQPPWPRLSMNAVHDKVSTFETNLRKKTLLLSPYILTSAVSDMCPVKMATMDGKRKFESVTGALRILGVCPRITDGQYRSNLIMIGQSTVTHASLGSLYLPYKHTYDARWQLLCSKTRLAESTDCLLCPVRSTNILNPLSSPGGPCCNMVGTLPNKESEIQIKKDCLKSTTPSPSAFYMNVRTAAPISPRSDFLPLPGFPRAHSWNCVRGNECQGGRTNSALDTGERKIPQANREDMAGVKYMWLDYSYMKPEPHDDEYCTSDLKILNVAVYNVDAIGSTVHNSKHKLCQEEEEIVPNSYGWTLVSGSFVEHEGSVEEHEGSVEEHEGSLAEHEGQLQGIRGAICRSLFLWMFLLPLLENYTKNNVGTVERFSPKAAMLGDMRDLLIRRFMQGDTLNEHIKNCKGSSPGSQKVMSTIRHTASKGTDSTENYYETVNASNGLRDLRGGVEELQNKQSSALNSDDDHSTPTKKSKRGIEDETRSKDVHEDSIDNNGYEDSESAEDEDDDSLDVPTHASSKFSSTSGVKKAEGVKNAHCIFQEEPNKLQKARDDCSRQRFLSKTLEWCYFRRLLGISGRRKDIKCYNPCSCGVAKRTCRGRPRTRTLSGALSPGLLHCILYLCHHERRRDYLGQGSVAPTRGPRAIIRDSFGNMLSSTIRCVLLQPHFVHWLMPYFYSRPGRTVFGLNFLAANLQQQIGERRPAIMLGGDAILLACALEFVVHGNVSSLYSQIFCGQERINEFSREDP
ncbi:hypothetical protein PR048_030044 [Dryococelus australis]|uniref:Uncharacterized protein n=1 Tax=Dryococelus australis TaxID=614101 RepID=A0ABQ9GBS3_9NEOP|nr:hypothetical protein PR048_030044 [Dryococelus australis]